MQSQDTSQVEADIPQNISDLYNVLGKVGEGTFGNVYLVHTKSQPKKVLAIKTFKTSKGEEGVHSTAVREISLLQELRHPNLVRLDDVHVSQEEASLSLAFQYADTDLYEMVRFHREKDRAGITNAASFHPYTLKTLMHQMLQGVNAMHQSWCMHRDIKPSNILVPTQGPDAGVLKIADFGLARIFKSPLRPLTDNGTVVTIWYRAPELLLGALHYTPAVDIWAVGCIFAELLTLRPLFQAEEVKLRPNIFQDKQMKRIIQVIGAPQEEDWPEVGQLQHWRDDTNGIRSIPNGPRKGFQNLKDHIMTHRATEIQKGSPGLDLLEQMLQYNPNCRITAAQALEHPYFKEAPLPGPNAFVYNGTRVANYPVRHVTPPSVKAPSLPASFAEPRAPTGAAIDAPKSKSITPLIGSNVGRGAPSMGKSNFSPPLQTTDTETTRGTSKLGIDSQAAQNKRRRRDGAAAFR